MEHGIRIVTMEKEHLKEVLEIECETFSDPWKRSDFEEAIIKEDRHYFSALANGTVIGYCGYWGSFEEAQIFNVAVKKEHRRKGVGRLLLNALIEFGRNDGRTRFLLEVRESNASARALYTSLGFREDGYRKNFYTNPPEAAVLMSCVFE